VPCTLAHCTKLVQRTALKVRSASQVELSNVKYMHSKHVKFGNKLAKVWFSANVSKEHIKSDCLNNSLPHFAVLYFAVQLFSFTLSL